MPVIPSMRWADALSTAPDLGQAVAACSAALGEAPEGGFDLLCAFVSPAHEDADDLLPAIHTLRRRHLVLVASTRELALGRLRDQRISDHRAALEVAAAHRYLAARRQAHAAVLGAGALILDVEPPALPLALVARYLDIKRAGRL